MENSQYIKGIGGVAIHLDQNDAGQWIFLIDVDESRITIETPPGGGYRVRNDILNDCVRLLRENEGTFTPSKAEK